MKLTWRKTGRRLEWDEVDGALCYEIKRNGMFLTITSQTVFLDDTYKGEDEPVYELTALHEDVRSPLESLSDQVQAMQEKQG